MMAATRIFQFSGWLREKTHALDAIQLAATENGGDGKSVILYPIS